MIPPDPELSPRRAARAEAERLATAALPVQSAAPAEVSPAEVSPDEVAAADGPTRRERRAVTTTPSGIRALVAARGLPLAVRRRRASVLAAAVVVAVAGVVAIGAAATAGGRDEGEAAPGEATTTVVQGPPAVPAGGLPVPQLAAVAATATPCDDPAFTAALASGDDTAVIAAAGGGSAFRAAVASGIAPCVSLSDPNREWVVVNKQRPLDPVDYRAGDLVMPANVRALEDSALRARAAGALTEMVRAASDAGAGEIGYLSAFRSYSTQQSTYAGRVSVGGVEEADRESARAGFSEHQTGLAVDIVPCDGSCATLDDVAGSPQGAWVRDHAWEFGFITRYAEGRESVSGYEPEAWHLRYIGPELARAYHEGGYTTLEEFFGLPAAPTY
ncbi:MULTISPECIES: M15 family metallopeptidase [Microbacterium]|uniref:M15 family metallopeptidase n=1 Tax=Microbacterium TaxID=33882 RepID=UPI00278A67AE|nr:MULTISPECIES: M15 family metallopeptidase [Microbacterium]MDQ1082705.1 D-alanyl-D-alanine carboxypeptidase [Microbacterium sp. SORGH_AS_0344]MDQ1168524.1 D-alanyl-D-alanine carboxypeptidase [Microbacterium proteolyticum]